MVKIMHTKTQTLVFIISQDEFSSQNRLVQSEKQTDLHLLQHSLKKLCVLVTSETVGGLWQVAPVVASFYDVVITG